MATKLTVQYSGFRNSEGCVVELHLSMIPKYFWRRTLDKMEIIFVPVIVQNHQYRGFGEVYKGVGICCFMHVSLLQFIL